MIYWTLKYGAIEKRVDEWGFSSPAIERISQEISRLTLLADGALCDSDPIFPFGSTVILFRCDDSTKPVTKTQWFYGRVTGFDPVGTGEVESVTYTLSCPLWYLDRTIYQIQWNYVVNPADPEPTIDAPYTSHLIINQGLNGSKLSTGAQITAVLQYAIDQGIPLQIGAGFPAVDPPMDEAKDMTCLEVIRRQMRWMPDAVLWVDHSTTPPTINCKRRSDLTLKTLALISGLCVESTRITPRYDILLPCVQLIFESTNEVNGTSYSTRTVDTVPIESTGREIGALVHTLDLAGSRATIASAAVQCGDISPLSVDWWKLKDKTLASAQVSELSIAEVTREFPVLALPREVINGAVAPWMNFTAQDETFTCQASFKISDLTDPDHPVVIWQGTRELTCKVRSTNANTGTYTSLQSFEAAEPVPVGLAQSIFDALGTLSFQGAVTLTENECSGMVQLGQKINLTGGRAEWSAMLALVQQISEDLETGRTTVSFGPPAHLGAADMVELLRVNRTRFLYTAPSIRTTGQVAGGSIEFGRETSKENTIKDIRALVQQLISEQLLVGSPTADKTVITPGAGTFTLSTVIGNPGMGTGSISLPVSACAGKDLSPVEMDACDKTTGEMWKVMVVASAPYRPS